MGNVVVWKPSPSAIASNWLIYQILLEAGLPPNVIQFVPGDAEQVTKEVLSHPDFSALHYTGSTAVFRQLYGQIAHGVAEGKYNGYPRIVGETGGKNFHLVHPTADVHNAVINTVRGAFEYQGQKCSACSRAYIPSSLAEPFISGLVSETRKLKIGDPDDFANFIGPVIHEAAFTRLSQAIDAAKNDPELELLCGGTYDSSTGYFVTPTIYKTTNPQHELMRRELFGPILCLYVYDDNGQHHHHHSASASTPHDPILADLCTLITATTPYALTGAVFAQPRPIIRQAEDGLRNAAGNFYINCKCTGAVVGQQPFGGARASGTNDKAGSANLLARFVSMRSVKEEFGGAGVPAVAYVSNEV
jgi:1-pyrroline-5-carboxylate dehydrogenase